MQKTCIAAFRRKKRSNLTKTMIKNDSIKNRVDDITNRTSKNHCNTNDKACTIILFDQPIKVITNKSDRDNSEYRQEQLSNHLNAKGHAGILCEIKIKPRRNLNALMQLEMRLYPDFQNLVERKEQ